MLRFVQSIVQNRHDAEDVTHEVFAKLMRAIQKYEEREVPFAAWIVRVARNAALDHVRSRRQIPVEEVWVSDDGQDETSFELARAQGGSCRAARDAARGPRTPAYRRADAERDRRTAGKDRGVDPPPRRAALKVSLHEQGAAPVTAASGRSASAR